MSPSAHRWLFVVVALAVIAGAASALSVTPAARSELASPVGYPNPAALGRPFTGSGPPL